MRLKSVALIWMVVGAAGNGSLRGQEYQHFSPILQPTAGTIGWDSFTPGNPGAYAGPHMADVIETGATGSALSVTPGGFKAGPNLYAFLSTPTWTIDLAGLDASQDYTSIGLQIATTPPPPGGGSDLDVSSFLLNGLAPSEFLSFGARTSLNAGGGQPPQDVNYYFAAWNGLAASGDYQLTVGPGRNHVVFAAARVDYLNSADSASRISVVPEPAMGLLTLLGCGVGAAGWLRRRRDG